MKRRALSSARLRVAARRLTSLLALQLLLAALASHTTHAHETPSPAELLKRAVSIAEDTGDFAAIEFLESQEDSAPVAAVYEQLTREMYLEKKDVSRMVAFGLAGIHYALEQASAADQGPDDTHRLKAIAKTIAYNLGANTWPGWDDPGIVIHTTDRAVGLESARLNLRLAVELQRQDDVLANAYWLLGAHLLARGEVSAAVRSIGDAAAHFEKSNQLEALRMCEGYIGIAYLLNDESAAKGKEELNSALDALSALGTDDAKFFVQQLKTAERIFVQDRP